MKENFSFKLFYTRTIFVSETRSIKISRSSNFSREEIQILNRKIFLKGRCVWKDERGILKCNALKKGGKVFRWKDEVFNIAAVQGHAYLTVQASAVVAHLASDAPLFRHRSVQLFARLVKNLGSFCSIIFPRRVIPGVVSALVPLHLGCMLQPCLKLHQSVNGEFRHISLSLSLYRSLKLK